jgi:hypothetical protein
MAEEKIIEKLKIILDKDNTEEDYLEIKHLPEQEAKTFIQSLKILPEYFFKLENKSFKKEELKKWAFIYILLHNLLHSEVKNENISKLEILTTSPIFISVKNILEEKEKECLALAYFLLSLVSLKNNPRLENLISEKLILSELLSLGGISYGIWGLKIKTEALFIASENILDKIDHPTFDKLIKKTQNIIFDFL